MKKLITITGMLCAMTLGFAQGAYDALNYSRIFTNGTARYNAMGGAFGALGGDFSSLSVNPAGIGVYRTSEFTFTPGFYFSGTESSTNFQNYSGNDVMSIADDASSSANISNIGYVGTWRSPKSEGLVSFSWGIGMNRLHDFNRNTVYSTTNNATSLTDVMAAEANADGLTPEILGTNQAWDQSQSWRNVIGWDAYLVDYDGGFFSPLLSTTTTNQDKYVQERGQVNEWAFSFGGNISHMLYFGATIGVQSLYYTRNSTFDETFISNESDYATYQQWDDVNKQYVYYTGGSFRHNDYLKTTGTGYNFKAGVIFRPVGFLRLGASIHTPTLYNLTDYYGQEMTPYNIKFREAGEDKYAGGSATPDGYYNYRLATPLKATGSAALVFGKVGLLSVDYELTDYNTMRLSTKSGGSSEFYNANSDIKYLYKASHAVRMGAELNLSKYFKVRGGAGYYSSPMEDAAYEVNENRVGDLYTFSGGLGFRSQSFFFDIAYVYRTSENENYLYNVQKGDDLEPVFEDILSTSIYNDHQLSFTVGFKF